MGVGVDKLSKFHELLAFKPENLNMTVLTIRPSSCNCNPVTSLRCCRSEGMYTGGVMHSSSLAPKNETTCTMSKGLHMHHVCQNQSWTSITTKLLNIRCKCVKTMWATVNSCSKSADIFHTIDDNIRSKNCKMIQHCITQSCSLSGWAILHYYAVPCSERGIQKMLHQPSSAWRWKKTVDSSAQQGQPPSLATKHRPKPSTALNTYRSRHDASISACQPFPSVDATITTLPTRPHFLIENTKLEN